jgi:uncharacterized ion transporter superfamily protein YfcC
MIMTGCLEIIWMCGSVHNEQIVQVDQALNFLFVGIFSAVIENMDENLKK